MKTPVCRPLLPRASALVPYLEIVDTNRRYSNHGELVQRLERRLGALFDEALVVAASSGSAALTAAILAEAGRPRPEAPLCLMPAYTFVATASAVRRAGYEPYLVDVDAQAWCMQPEALAAHPALTRAGCVVAVAPYGRAWASHRWRAFRERTGVPVVIDAAAAFEALTYDPRTAIDDVPITLSFHATKAFAAGEGGAIVTRDATRAQAAYRALNFGFLGDRVSRTESINGKMSEYHAAVGLAELDGWPRKQASLRRVADAYLATAAAQGIAGRILTAPEIASCYALFRAGDAREAAAVCTALDRADAEYRYWYGTGIDAEPAFADAQRDSLEVTRGLAPRLIGLPIAPDLAVGEITRIVAVIGDAVHARV